MVVDRTRTYLAMIENSVGSNIFRHLYVTHDDQTVEDVTDNGQYSCAVFVSSLLTLQGMIDRPHATVGRTVEAMQEAGWHSVEAAEAAEAGDILQWGAGDDGHEHIGFVLNSSTAVSNSAELGTPAEHPFTMSDGRQPIAFWHYTVTK